jgi:hypothetical protein
VARDFDNGVFGDVLRDEKARQEAAKREAQRSGKGGGKGAAGPDRAHKTKEPDAFDALTAGRDPDAPRGSGGGRVKLGG